MDNKEKEVKIYSKDEFKNSKTNKNNNRKFLSFYIIGLFSLAIIIILLSYLTQVRAKETINEQISALQGTERKVSELQTQLQTQTERLNKLSKELEIANASVLETEKTKLVNAELLKFIKVYELVDNKKMKEAKEIDINLEILPIEIVTLYNKIIK